MSKTLEQAEFDKLVGEKLVQLRKKFSLTQEDVAKTIGISRVNITNIEKGKQRITVYNLYKLAENYGFNINEVIFPEGKIDLGAEKEIQYLSDQRDDWRDKYKELRASLIHLKKLL